MKEFTSSSVLENDPMKRLGKPQIAVEDALKIHAYRNSIVRLKGTTVGEFLELAVDLKGKALNIEKDGTLILRIWIPGDVFNGENTEEYAYNYATGERSAGHQCTPMSEAVLKTLHESQT